MIVELFRGLLTLIMEISKHVLLRLLILFGQFFGVLGKLERIDKLLDISVDYIVEVVYGKPDPVICNTTLWKIIRAYFGATITCTNEAFSLPGNFFLLFAHLLFV